MQAVSDAEKLAFRTSPIKRKFKLFIDWIAKGDTAGVVTASEWDATYFGKDNVNNAENNAPCQPFIFSDSMTFNDNARFISNKFENGVMLANRSDANGDFSSAEVISIIYTDVQTVTHLTITASTYNYLVDFDFYYRDATNTSWVLIDNYVGVAIPDTVYDFGADTNIKGWKIEVTKISAADMMVNIIEVQAGYRDDITDDIVSMRIEKKFEDTNSGSLSIGNITANRLDITLNNTHQRYNPKNTASDVYAYLKSNRALIPYIGIDMGGSITYFAQGIFYMRNLVPKPDMTVDIFALDRMWFLNDEDFNTSTLYEAYTIKELVEEMLAVFGMTASEYSVDTTTGDIPYAWFEPRRYAENLKRLALAEGGLANFNELGVLDFKARAWQDTLIRASYDDDNILLDSAESPLKAENMKNSISIKVNPLVLQAEEQVYSLSQTISIPASSSISIVCYFSKIPCKAVADAALTAGADITITSETKYAYATFITLTNAGGVAEDVTALTIAAQPLISTGTNIVKSEDAALIAKYGKSEYKINSEFIQDISYAQTLADDLKTDNKDPEAEIDFSSLCLPYLQLGDLIAIKHTKLNIGGAL